MAAATVSFGGAPLLCRPGLRGGGLAAISYIWYMSRQKAIMLEVALAMDELRLLLYQTDAIDRGAAYGSYEIGGPTGPVSAVCKGGQQGWPPCVDISIP